MTFKIPPVPIETTYADLREGEVIVDKSGNHWTAREVTHTKTQPAPFVAFWLVDATGVKAHLLNKMHGDAVTVLRAPSRDDDIARREAEVDAAEAYVTPSQAMPDEVFDEALRQVVPVDDSVQRAIERALGGEVLAEESVEVEAQRDAAEADPSKPMALPPFSEFTDLEKRSHLFLVHGVYAHDVKSRKRLDELHDEDHARGDARDGHVFTAHTHDGTMPA